MITGNFPTKFIKFKIFIFLLIIIISFTFIHSQDKPITCLKESCYSFGGNCNREGTCTCHEGYLTDKTAILKCDYRQISSIKSGLIELATGCGLGHFYAGRKWNGLFKFFIMSIFCTMCMSSFIMIKKIREETEAEDHPYVTLIVVIATVFKVVIIMWQLLDGVLFFLRFYRDGRDFPLY